MYLDLRFPRVRGGDTVDAVASVAVGMMIGSEMVLKLNKSMKVEHG
jgi:hypothetical protein